MLDASFIVLIGFLVFIITALWFGYRKSLGLLDSKIDEVKSTLELAQSKKQAALLELKKQQESHGIIDQEVSELQQRTLTQIKELNETIAHEIERLIANRQQSFEVHIERARNAAIDELNATITEMATQKLIKLLNNMPESIHQQINAFQLQELERLIGNGHNSNGNMPHSRTNHTSEKMAGYSNLKN